MGFGALRGVVFGVLMGVWVCGCVGVWVCGCVYIWKHTRFDDGRRGRGMDWGWWLEVAGGESVRLALIGRK